MTIQTKFSVLAFLFATSILFWWRPLVATVELALANDAYTHILLILPLSAALIYMDSKYKKQRMVSDALAAHSEPGRIIGVPLLIVALLIAAFARWGMHSAPDDVRLSFAMFALVIWWIASVLLSFGVRTFQAFLFPLCFLFLIVPIPQALLGSIIEFLQQQSAIAAQILFRIARVPVTRDGIILSIPGLDIEVARECSSIRSSLMLLVTALVLAHLFLRYWWRKIVFVLAVIPLAVAKNGVRIFTIVELGTRIDPAFLTGKLHHNGGILFFGLSVIAGGVLLWILRRTERPSEDNRIPVAVKPDSNFS